MSLPMPEPGASARFLVPEPGPDADGLVGTALRRAGSATGTSLRWVRLVEDRPPGHLGPLDDGVLVVDAQPSPSGEPVPDLAMTAALSAVTGGFVISQPLGPAGERAGCAVAYAGHRLATEPPGRPADSLQESSDLLYSIAGRSLGTLYGNRASEEGEATVQAAGNRNGEASSGPADVAARLVLAVTTAEAHEVREVLSSRRTDLRGDWRLLRRLAPEMAPSFTMVRSLGRDAALPDSVLEDLSGDLGRFAAAVDLPATSVVGAARWVRTGPGGLIDTGSADSVAAVITALSGVAAVLGTYPASLAWPATQAGEPLDEPA